MEVDEASAWKYTDDGTTRYFCGKACVSRFLRGRGLDESLAQKAVGPASRWYSMKTVIAFGASLLFLVVSSLVPFLRPVGDTFLMYVGRMWWALLLGLVIGGIVDHFVPREYVSYFLAAPRKRTVFYSVFFGFFMSVCSHGILALAIEIYKKGASTASVVAFLLASPWANLPLTLLLIGFFGLKAFFFIFGAILVAVVTGLVFQFLEERGWVERNVAYHPGRGVDLKEDLKRRIREFRFSPASGIEHLRGIGSGMVSLSEMVVWWILLGAFIASAVAAYVPPDFLSRYMGLTLGGLMVTLLVATVIEVCSEGTAPLAFELYRQTGAFGNAFVFLMAGVVTDFTEIGLIWLNVGRRAAIWLPLISVPQVILLGILANHLF